MKFVRKVLTVIDYVAICISLLVIVGLIGVGVAGAARNVLKVARQVWHDAGTEEAIIWSTVAFCFIWVAVRWKRLNKR